MTWRLNEQTKRKYEAAERLGLTSRLAEEGWPGLSAQETGRIGACLRRSRRPHRSHRSHRPHSDNRS